jgi:hypothetical protein
VFADYQPARGQLLRLAKPSVTDADLVPDSHRMKHRHALPTSRRAMNGCVVVRLVAVDVATLRIKSVVKLERGSL